MASTSITGLRDVEMRRLYSGSLWPGRPPRWHYSVQSSVHSAVTCWWVSSLALEDSLSHGRGCSAPFSIILSCLRCLWQDRQPRIIGSASWEQKPLLWINMSLHPKKKRRGWAVYGEESCTFFIIDEQTSLNQHQSQSGIYFQPWSFKPQTDHFSLQPAMLK